jgi:serine/threonine protein phosphatase 1
MACTNLSDRLAGPYREIDVDDWDRIVVVGDVHGCRATLDRLLDRIEIADTDLVIFVGDLVRKGPDSQGVVDLVRSRDNLMSVRGNNEQKILDGDAGASLDAPARSYLESMPVGIGWGDCLAVHGGVDPDSPLKAHSREELLTMRSVTPDGGYDGPFWFQQYSGPPRVFFGHTVLAEPYVSEWAVGLDTGCVYGGKLTAHEPATGATVTVEPEQTYRDREHENIATPGAETAGVCE